jgi:hypothetical protein
MGWRRFLGFLAMTEATALEIAPAERSTIERVRRFADHLAETNTPHSIAGQMDALYGAARIMLPERTGAGSGLSKLACTWQPARKVPPALSLRACNSSTLASNL